MGPFMPGTRKFGSNVRFFRIVLLMNKVTSSEFKGGRLSVEQIDRDLISVTVTGVSCFANGTELARAIGEAFKSRCQSRQSPEGGLLWDYDFVYQLTPGLDFRNPEAFLAWVEARLKLTISLLDDVETVA
jgi:hypothetical protein